MADDADVAGAIAEVLGAGDRGLLVLDNCEHVLDGAAGAVEELLARCPDLRILATSRAPLGVDGEQVLRLCGLEPAGAVDLFVDRARAADGIVDLPAIGAAVPAAGRPAAGDRARGGPHALDGARRDRRAARRAVQPADGAGPPRGRPPLDPASRDRLVVRAARRAAAAAVRAAVGVRARLRARRRGGGVRGRRASTARRWRRCSTSWCAIRWSSLGVVGGRTRYSLLETLREYGAERLAARGEHERLAERHADHYVTRARRALDRGWRESKLPFFDEFDELRAAVRRCERDERAGPGVHARRGAVVAGALPPRGGDARLAEETLERWPGDPPAATAGARGGVGRPAGHRRRGGRAAARRRGARARGRPRRGRAPGPPHARADRVLRRRRAPRCGPLARPHAPGARRRLRRARLRGDRLHGPAAARGRPSSTPRPRWRPRCATWPSGSTLADDGRLVALRQRRRPARTRARRRRGGGSRERSRSRARPTITT